MEEKKSIKKKENNNKEQNNKIELNYCFSCKKWFSSEASLNAHFQTKKHQENSKD